jgi:hypothetical protein
MVFDANIDAKGDRTDQSNHHDKVSLVSIHNKSILGTLGIVVVILGLAIAVWIFHHKRMQPSWPSRTPQESRPFAMLKEGKLTTNNNSKKGQGSFQLGSLLTQLLLGHHRLLGHWPGTS